MRNTETFEIPGYPFFRVTKDGMVWSTETEELVPQLDYQKSWYIYDKRSQQRVAVHKLMGYAFLGSKFSAERIGHLDKNKYNNNLDNLYNQSQAAEEKRLAKLTERQTKAAAREEKWLARVAELEAERQIKVAELEAKEAARDAKDATLEAERQAKADAREEKRLAKIAEREAKAVAREEKRLAKIAELEAEHQFNLQVRKFKSDMLDREQQEIQEENARRAEGRRIYLSNTRP